MPAGERKTIAEVEADHIRRILEHTGGNRTVAAQILGVSRVGLLSKIKRYGIEAKPRPGAVTEDGRETDVAPTEPRPAR